MSKLLVSLSVSEKYNWCAFKQITVIEEQDLIDLSKINPYFDFFELMGRHTNTQFYFKDLNVKVISNDVKEIEYLEKLGVTDAGIKDLDLIEQISSRYPQWREGIFDEHYDRFYAKFNSLGEVFQLPI